MSVENGNSIDEKNKAGRTIVALSIKELTKPNGPMKHGISDIDRRNGSAEDRKSARSKDTDHADVTRYKDQDSVKDTIRGAIATLATMDGSIRRSKSPRMPTRMKGVDGTD